MKSKLFLLLAAFSLIVSCAGGNSGPKTSTGNVTFQLGGSSSSTVNQSKNMIHVPNLDLASISNAKSVIVSIANSKGQTVIDTKQLNLYNMNGSFISEPIPLNVGQYTLTKYLVLDASNNVIYVTPITGSAKAYLVQNPLPLSFTVAKDQVTTVTPEIIDATSGNPQDFGYTTFTFNLVPTLNVMVAVFISSNGNYRLATATITVTSNNNSIYSGNLSAITNTLQIKDVDADYIVVVSKPGYQNYANTFSNAQMKDYGKTPLMITLEENGSTGQNTTTATGAIVTSAPDGTPAVITREKSITTSYYALVSNLQSGNAGTQTAEMQTLSTAISNNLSTIVAQNGISQSALANATVDVRIMKGYRADSLDQRFIGTNKDGGKVVTMPSLNVQQLKGQVADILTSGFGDAIVDKTTIKDLIDDDSIYPGLSNQVQLYTVANYFFNIGQSYKIETLATRSGKTVDIDGLNSIAADLSVIAPIITNSGSTSTLQNINKSIGNAFTKIAHVVSSPFSKPNRDEVSDNKKYHPNNDAVANALDGNVVIPDGSIILKRSKGESGQQGLLKIVQYWTHGGVYSEELNSKFSIDPDGRLIDYTARPCVLTADCKPGATLQSIDYLTSPTETDNYSILQVKGWNAAIAKQACRQTDLIFNCSALPSGQTFPTLSGGAHPIYEFKSSGHSYDLPYLEALNGSVTTLFWFFDITLDYGDTSHNLQADNVYCTKVAYTGWKIQGFDIDSHEGPGDLIGPDSVADSAVDKGYWTVVTLRDAYGVYTKSVFTPTYQSTTNVICSQNTGWLSPTVIYNGNRNTGGNAPTDPMHYTSGLSAIVLGNTQSLVRDGYTFAGWNTAFDGSGTTYNQGSTFTMGKANTTLYATWTPILYSATYNGNGATGGSSPIDSNQYIIWQVVTIPGNTGNLVRPGYSFIGWNTAPDGNGFNYTQGNTIPVPAMNITLYAKWSLNPTYTITYNGNGSNSGSVPIDGTSYEQGIPVTVIGNTGNLGRTGYSFAGWNTAYDASGTNYTQNSILTMGSANVILYAVWTANPTYKVTYDANGTTSGDVPTDTGNYEVGFLVTTLGNTGNLVRTGYTFSGWCISSSGVGTTYAQGAQFVMSPGNVTLYASWNKIPTYNVTYNPNGATGGSVPIDTNNYENGNTITVLGNTGILVKTGNTFASWNTKADGSGTTYNQGSAFAMASYDVSLFAIWTPNPTYTVNYNQNGATGGVVPVDTQNYENGNTITVLGNPGNLARTGYSFVGWNTNSDGSGTTYLGNASFSMGTQNVVLYALWSAIPTYKVIYDGNGNTSGSPPVDSTNYTSGQSVTVLSIAIGNLQKSDSFFVGWNTASDGNGTMYNPGQIFSIGTGNITLFAIWKKIYFAGCDSSNRACYWVGKVKTILDTSSSFTSNVYVENGIIYTCGADSSGRACYWVGTAKTILDGRQCNAMVVNNGIVYTCGFDSSGRACYWVGTAKILLDGKQAYSICVNNGIVYTCGYDNSQLGHACYWVGTARTMLESNSPFSMADKIFINNNTLYIAGVVGDVSNTFTTACYWKVQNGITNVKNIDNGQALAIYVDPAGLVYIAGQDGSFNACYWVGTAKTIFTSSAGAAYVSSIRVINGIIVTTGADNSGYGCYWIGETKGILEVNSYGISVFF